MSVNSELVLQIAVTQNFHLLLGAHKTVRAKQFRRNRFASRKNVQVLHVDDVEGRTKRAAKAALWYAAMQRHLATFKSPAARITAAGLLSFVAFARSTSEF